MFRVSVGEYEVGCHVDGLPAMLSDYQQRAARLSDIGWSKRLRRRGRAHFMFDILP